MTNNQPNTDVPQPEEHPQGALATPPLQIVGQWNKMDTVSSKLSSVYHNITSFPVDFQRVILAFVLPAVQMQVLILLYMKNIFQKMSVCVLMHLIGQNDRAVCKRHGLSWRCIREVQSALRSRAGPAGHWARAVSLSLAHAPVSQICLSGARMPPSHLHAGPSSLSWSERRGNSSLS